MGISSEDLKEKPVMGYPSMDRYHHHQQQYPHMQPAYPVPIEHHTYSSSSIHNNGKYPVYPENQNFGASSSNAYYYQPQPYLPMMPEYKKETSFGRVMLILMVVLVAGMCAMSLIMWFLFGTNIPDFHVSSLTLSNFTATNSSFTGRWDTNLTIVNSNQELEIDFYKVRSSIFYREAMVGIASIPPFQLLKNHSLTLNISVPAEQMVSSQNMQNAVLPNLIQDKKNGELVFSLRLAFLANFTASNIVYRAEIMRVSCENLLVNVTEAGDGILSDGAGSDCLIRVSDNVDNY